MAPKKAAKRAAPRKAASASYEGTNVSTGSQTPESVTTPTDVMDSGVAGGMTSSDTERSENA